MLVGPLIFLVTRGGDDDESAATGSAPSVQTGVPTVLSESDLRAFGRAQAVPVYWAGPQPNRRYELTRTANGRIYIRYLTPSAQVGSKQARFLTVGTYPARTPTARCRPSDGVRARSRFGRSPARSWSGRRRSAQVYFSFPAAKFQVEVYAPEAGRAKSLVLDGRVERLG